MKSTTGDLSLYRKHIAERLIGFSGISVDAMIESGCLEFQTLLNLLGKI